MYTWLCTTPACFSTFVLIYYRPYSSWKFLSFLYTSLLIFLQIIIIVWWTHAYHINGIMPPSYQQSFESEISITHLCQLCSTHYIAKRIKNWHQTYNKYRSYLVMSSWSKEIITIATFWSQLCNHLHSLFHASPCDDKLSMQVYLRWCQSTCVSISHTTTLHTEVISSQVHNYNNLNPRTL